MENVEIDHLRETNFLSAMSEVASEFEALENPFIEAIERGESLLFIGGNDFHEKHLTFIIGVHPDAISILKQDSSETPEVHFDFKFEVDQFYKDTQVLNRDNAIHLLRRITREFFERNERVLAYKNRRRPA